MQKRRVSRYPGPTPNWEAIAKVVETVARAVAAPGYAVDPADPTTAVIDVDVTGLTEDDVRVVGSWFHPRYERPRSDPWRKSVANGRHRLWATWQATPEAVLPIYSECLIDLDQQQACAELAAVGDEFSKGMVATFAVSIPRQAFEGLSQLDPDRMKASPLYIAELRRVARLGGHDVDGLPRVPGVRDTPAEEPAPTSWWSRLVFDSKGSCGAPRNTRLHNNTIVYDSIVL